jgi:hypothetical protein
VDEHVERPPDVDVRQGVADWGATLWRVSAPNNLDITAGHRLSLPESPGNLYLT